MRKIKISFADLANKLKIGLDEKKTVDISSLEIKIKSYDIVEDKEVYKSMTHFIVKDSVNSYCLLGENTKEQLKTSLSHRTWDLEKKEWKESSELIKLGKAVLVNEPIQIVDCTVQDTKCYIANGFINHNTTPGGKAVKFAASVRIKLMGKSPVKILDPAMQAEYERLVLEWEVECENWKNEGGKKTNRPKPEKPKKGDFKGNEVTIGYDVVAKTVKNKVGPPDREAEFRIIFTQGIIEEEAWFDYADKFKIIEKVTAFDYKFSDDSKIVLNDSTGTPIVFKRSEWLENVMADCDIRELVKEKIVNRLVIPTRSASYVQKKLTDES